jgi:hypothetical protein
MYKGYCIEQMYKMMKEMFGIKSSRSKTKTLLKQVEFVNFEVLTN